MAFILLHSKDYIDCERLSFFFVHKLIVKLFSFAFKSANHIC